MAEKNGAAGQEDGSGNGSPTTIKVTVDEAEKVLTQEDVQNLVNQRAGVEERSKTVASVIKAAERYGTDVETLLHNSEAALGIANQLIEKGIINEQGEVIEKKKEEDVKPDLFVKDDDSKGLNAEARTIAIVAKILKPELDKIGGRIDDIDSGLTSVFRKSIQDEIQKKYPTLSDDEVSQVFGAASKDQDKGIWDHAKETAERKDVSRTAIEKEFAEKHGLDINQLNEQSADGGGGPTFEGVDFKFKHRKLRTKDDKAMTPEAGLQAILKAGARESSGG